jgi:peroxiredoxin
VRLTDTAGMVRFLNVVDTLSSPAGQAATCQLEQLRGQLPPGAVVYTVTRDVPAGLQRWCADEAILHEILSTEGNPQFASDYGLDLEGTGRLQRAIVVVSRNDRIAHADYTGSPEGEPDLAAALDALQHAAN